MDDLVVVIVTLLIAGAGAIGQLKKKKQLPVETEEPKTPEDIWAILRGETFTQKPYSAPVFDEIEKEESDPYINEQGYKFEAKNEGGLLVNTEIKVHSPDVKITTKNKSKFPLRKAIIYSEILNRKYI